MLEQSIKWLFGLITLSPDDTANFCNMVKFSLGSSRNVIIVVFGLNKSTTHDITTHLVEKKTLTGDLYLPEAIVLSTSVTDGISSTTFETLP